LWWGNFGISVIRVSPFTTLRRRNADDGRRPSTHARKRDLPDIEQATDLEKGTNPPDLDLDLDLPITFRP